MPDPPPCQIYLERGWKLLQAYYDWEVRRGRPAMEAGLHCKILAYFHEQFMGRFFSSPTALQVSLDEVTAEILDAYLGGWYLAESGLADPADLERQLASLRQWIEYLGGESRYRGSEADWRALEHHLDDSERFRRRLRGWEELQREIAGGTDWIERQERWLSGEW